VIDSQRYKIFYEVVGMERSASTTEEVLERKSSGSGLKNRDYVVGIHGADHATSILRSWHLFPRQAAVAQMV
jgi:hypothetical protein